VSGTADLSRLELHTTYPSIRALRLDNSVAESEETKHLAIVPTEADVVFVRVDEGHYHRVWITRDDDTTFGVRLHVAHDLPHFAVESAFAVTDGLWGHLVATGDYLGLTVEHLVAKALTNAVAPSVPAMRERLATFHRDEATRRDSFDADAAAAMVQLLEQRLRGLDDAMARRAYETRAVLLERWAKTALGDTMTLHWPLDT
jgi:hypothetical protein